MIRPPDECPSLPPRRRRVLVWATGLALSLALAIALFPKVLTGDFLELTVRAIRIDPEGRVEIDFAGRASSGTGWGTLWISKGTLERRSRGSGVGFPAWPREVGCTEIFELASPEERERGLRDSPELRNRIMVREKETHRIGPFDRLIYYRRLTAGGGADEASLTIWGKK